MVQIKYWHCTLIVRVLFLFMFVLHFCGPWQQIARQKRTGILLLQGPCVLKVNTATELCRIGSSCIRTCVRRMDFSDRVFSSTMNDEPSLVCIPVWVVQHRTVTITTYTSSLLLHIPPVYFYLSRVAKYGLSGEPFPIIRFCK